MSSTNQYGSNLSEDKIFSKQCSASTIVVLKDLQVKVSQILWVHEKSFFVIEFAHQDETSPVNTQSKLCYIIEKCAPLESDHTVARVRFVEVVALTP